MTRTLTLALFASVLTACQPDGDSVDCTAEAVGSVNVRVVDGADQPTEAFDSIVYDSESFDEDCECWEPGQCVCGWEVAGPIDITVTACGGSQVITETVTVEEDVCHVIPEALTITLDPCDAPS